MVARLTGSFVAPPTPFNNDGSVDLGGFATWIDFHHRNGTSALLIVGSTGEVSTLSRVERQRIIAHCQKHARAGMSMWYGCTDNNTRATIEMIKIAAAEGADGAVLTVPAYVAIPEDDAVEFFMECADASPIPIAIYNNPTRVKTDLQADHMIGLAKHPNITVFKEAMSRPAQIAKILAAGADVSVMCCDSPNLGLIVPTMSLGGHGTSNMTGNLAPQEMAMLSRPWTSGEDALAFRDIHQKLLPLMVFNYSAGNPIPIKSLCRALGMPSGDMRRPYRMLNPSRIQVGIDIMRELGLLKKYGYEVRAPLVMAS